MTENTNYGELVPVGGGDPIPLLKKKLLLGRRESCDIVLRFPNISAHHCQLTVNNGYWYVQDLNSRNGVKVNSTRVGVEEKRIDPGAVITVAKQKFELRYSPQLLGAVGAPPEDAVASVFGKSLLERAGLTKKGALEADDDTTDVEDFPVRQRPDAKFFTRRRR